MTLPLHDRAHASINDPLVRLTGGAFPSFQPVATTLIPERPLAEGEQYRFHFDMTKCIGCRSCEIACNEQNGNPADIHWRRVGEVEGGVYPNTQRHYLSMGCNHCLDAECLKGCPVDAYTKDPATGIVLHSADACIGCQYCVWNCPYQVPQFNAERGVVGKCDMCHGRLTDGFEPACVNACPEGAIQIEIVNKLAWRVDYATAESPGMPPAEHTISTTRITLPETSAAGLHRVDTGRVRQEHPHWSLVVMTTLIQAIIGALCFLPSAGRKNPVVLGLLAIATALTLNLSVLHLGRPAYAWRAVKMWRRSWLSREVLLFGLFFASLCAITAIAAQPLWQKWVKLPLTLNGALPAAAWLTMALGIAGIVASAFIYLIPARPAWNKIHTPLDFLLSAALLGSVFSVVVTRVAIFATHLHLRTFTLSNFTPAWHWALPAWVVSAIAAIWLTNQGVRMLRLERSFLFEEQASADLVLHTSLARIFAAAMFLVTGSTALALAGYPALAFVAALGGVLCARYIFFVSVVPLNMALTFLRAGER
jgi:formate dehydrogenase iron-sulfur subunit